MGGWLPVSPRGGIWDMGPTRKGGHHRTINMINFKMNPVVVKHRN